MKLIINYRLKVILSLIIFIIIFLVTSCARDKPTEPTPPPQTDYLKKGWEYYENNNYDLAIESFKEAIKNNPSLADAYNGLGWSYMKLNEITKAIDAYNEAAKRSKPSDTYYISIHVGRGGAYYIIQDLQKAKESLEKVIEIIGKDNEVWRFEHNPEITEPRVYAQLALCYYKLGDRDKALEYAKKVRDNYATVDPTAKKIAETIITWGTS